MGNGLLHAYEVWFTNMTKGKTNEIEEKNIPTCPSIPCAFQEFVSTLSTPRTSSPLSSGNIEPSCSHPSQSGPQKSLWEGAKRPLGL